VSTIAPTSQADAPDVRSLPPQRRVSANEDFLAVAWRRKGLIAAAGMLGALVAVVVITNTTPTYTSTSRLYVEQEPRRLIAEFQNMGVVLGKSVNFLNTQAELITSTPILRIAAELPGISDLRTLRGDPDIVRGIRKQLSVTVGSKDDIINVSCRSHYREDAAEIANAVVKAYIEYYARRQRSSATDALRILRAEKERRERELAQKMLSVIEFKKVNGVLSFESDNLNHVFTRLARLSEVYTEAQLETIAVRAKFNFAQPPDGKNVEVGRVNAADLPPPKAADVMPGGRLSEALERLDTLKLSFTDEHPLVRSAQAAVDRLRKEYQDEARRQYAAALSKQNEIAKLLQQQKQKAEELDVKAATYAMLVGDVDRTKKLLDILDTRIKELDFTQDTAGPTITLLEPAVPARFPSAPQGARIMAIGVLAGLVTGIGLALLRDATDKRLRSLDDAAEAAGAPVLGMVPLMPVRQSLSEHGQQVYLHPTSSASEAFRSLLTALEYAGAGISKLLLTSPQPGEGRSTLAGNLAIAAARSRRRVILVDADFRSPAQHRIFPTECETGLADILLAGAALEEAVHRTTLRGLDILPAGTPPANPSEVFSDRSFSLIVDKLAEDYDLVILDSPAVLPTADARILATVCDATILVLRSDHTLCYDAAHAGNCLRSVGAFVLGVVVNGLKLSGNRVARCNSYYCRSLWQPPDESEPVVCLPPDESDEDEKIIIE